MGLAIDVGLSFRLPRATDFLLQLEAAALPEQAVTGTLALGEVAHFARVPAEAGIGERIWIRHEGVLALSYRATVEVRRVVRALAGMGQVAPHRLPGETVPYLLNSHYCPAERFRPFVEEMFPGLAGGAKVEAMRAWIARKLRYAAGTSDASTTAVDTFVERRGVCRDFAHLMVAFARAAGIPARFVSVYAPDVDPPDFHAVAELFLEGPEGGEWQLVDPTGMADSSEMARIGVGRDAGDVAFLTSFGAVEDVEKGVAVSRCEGIQAGGSAGPA